MLKLGTDFDALLNDEYTQKHDEFIMILLDNKKNLNPSRENSLELFIFAYCRFQEFIGWINKDELNTVVNKIVKELKDKCYRDRTPHY